jgi:glycosyltransferase involved in cell wall biosynthesis
VRVLHVITGLAPGGAEHQVRLLVRHSGADAEVAVLTNPGTVAAGLRDDGVRVHEIGMRSNRDPSGVARLVRLMRRGRFELVHTHLFRAGVYGRVAARLAGVRAVVATEHSLTGRLIEGRRISAGVRALYLATERLGRVTIAVSSAVAQRLTALGVPADRVVVVPNGIEAGSFRYDPDRRRQVRADLGIAPDAFVVGALGRLVEFKHFDVMLDALDGVPDAVALLVGAGPMRAALEGQARDLGLTRRVRFTGECTDIPGMLSAMDVLAAPSRGETFGLAVVEALASGLPVLYTSCPALQELPAGAAPGAHWLPSDPSAFRIALAAQMASGPRRLPPPAAVAHYDAARLAGRIDEIYDAVCRRPFGPVTAPGRHRVEGAPK